MSGLTTPSTTSWTHSGDRTFTIEVTGACDQGHRQINYAVKIPYSRMGAAIRSIQRSGGKIASVSQDGMPPADPAQSQAIEPILKSTTQAIVYDLIALRPEPQVEPKAEPQIQPKAPAAKASPAAAKANSAPVAHGFQAIETGKKAKKRKR
jgi:hypothetical protein